MYSQIIAFAPLWAQFHDSWPLHVIASRTLAARKTALKQQAARALRDEGLRLAQLRAAAQVPQNAVRRRHRAAVATRVVPPQHPPTPGPTPAAKDRKGKGKAVGN